MVGIKSNEVSYLSLRGDYPYPEVPFIPYFTTGKMVLFDDPHDPRQFAFDFVADFQ